MIPIILQQHDEEVNQNSLEKRTGCNVVKTAAIFIRMETLSVMEIRREEFEAAREDIIKACLDGSMVCHAGRYAAVPHVPYHTNTSMRLVCPIPAVSTVLEF